MGITTAMCTSFKSEVLGGVHDLDTHTLKLALIKSGESGTYGAATTNYSAGGQNLDSATIATDGTTATVDFADEVFSNVTCSAAGCIIYNSSASNKAICVISFGGTVSATAGDLTIEFPAAAASTAVIRIA